MDNFKSTAYSDYRIADIAEDDLKNICELEKSLSTRTNEDIVLIAYKHCQSETESGK